MKDFSSLVIVLGIILVVGGLAFKAGFPLGRLPGDIRIQGDNFRFYLPITTSILLSLVLSFILWLLK